MTVKQAIELSGALKSIKFGALNIKKQVELIELASKLKKEVDSYKEKLELIRDQNKPNGYDELYIKLHKHELEINSKGRSNILTATEYADAKNIATKYIDSIKVLAEEFLKSDVSFTIPVIPKDQFQSIVEANNEIAVEQFTILYETLVS